jgi:hypothetical protein
VLHVVPNVCFLLQKHIQQKWKEKERGPLYPRPERRGFTAQFGKVNVKPGAKTKNTWSLYVYSNYFTSVSEDAHVKIHKVLFKNGTAWEEVATSSNL